MRLALRLCVITALVGCSSSSSPLPGGDGAPTRQDTAAVADRPVAQDSPSGDGAREVGISPDGSDAIADRPGIDSGDSGVDGPRDGSPDGTVARDGSPDGMVARSCAPRCDRCVNGVCCGAGCCNAGEWCDESSGTPTCRCGAGEACAPPNTCNAPVVLANGCGSICCRGSQCPISRRAYKDDIHYLDAQARQQVYADLLRIRLARYHYKGTPASATARLGFIIDDAPPGSPAVNVDGQTVDLYAYMSMAVAGLQEQAREIERLRAEVERLRRRPPRGSR